MPHVVSFKFFYCYSITVVPILPPLLSPAPAPIPTANPHPVVHVHGSFIFVPADISSGMPVTWEALSSHMENRELTYEPTPFIIDWGSLEMRRLGPIYFTFLVGFL